MGKTKRPYFRKRFLVNPKLQLTIIGFNVGLAALAICIFYIENLFLFAKFTGSENPDLVADPIIMDLIREEQFKMHIVFGVTALVVLLALTIGGLILSNRIAGPIYRLQKHMDDIAKGNIKKEIAFREKDFFPELAEGFNKLVQSFRKN